MSQNREQLKRELGGNAPPPAAPPAKVEKVVAAKPAVVTLHHHDTCPGIRGKECTCAANLTWLIEAKVKPLERQTCTWVEVQLKDGKKLAVPHTVELWRVDDGKEFHTTTPAPNALKKPMPKVIHLPPRWVCTACGWGGRGSEVSHRCDKAAVALATRLASVASTLTVEQRFSGSYRLAIWQDADLIYHLVEEYIENGQVKAMVEIDTDGNYSVIEGALLSASVDRFAP